MQELFDAVRAACPPGIWSRAVELVRQFAVTRQNAETCPIVCRVRQPNRAIPATVQIYPADAEWDCDCDSRATCCEHVAAVVIALRKAQSEGKDLPAALSSAANLGYGLARCEGELKLERFIVRDSQRVPLRVSLTTAVAQHTVSLDFAPSQEDLQLDRIVGTSGRVRADQIHSVFKLLSGHRNVEFEGHPVEVVEEALRPRATISKSGEEFLVRLAPDPSIREIVASHVAWTGTKLVLLAATEYSGAKYERLVPERYYGQEQLAELVTEVLPELRRWFVVELTTDELPEVTDEERPRIVLEVSQEGDQLTALATMVYGDPPIARVDRQRLVHLGGPVPMRKLDLERRATEHLRQSLGLGLGVRETKTGKDAVTLATKLDHWHGEIVGTEPDQWVHEVTVRPRLEFGYSLPRFMARAAEDGELRATSAAVVRAYRSGLSVVPLIDGGFARLPMDWLSRHIELLEQLLSVSPDEDPAALPSYAAPTRLALYEALGTPVPPDLTPVRQLLSDARALSEPMLPEGLTIELRPYQRQGVAWLQLMKQLGLGAILADDMGLGKTVQVLCAIETPTLVVCPTSLVANWRAEIQRFLPRLRINEFHGPERALSDEASVTLTSYALLRQDIERLAERTWAAVVLDEAQTIKNPESQVAQAAYRLKGRFRVAMTGTPIENRLEDLWSQFQFTNPGLLGSRDDFAVRFADKIRAGDAECQSRLRKTITPFVLRRTKAQVTPELPPRIERDVYFELEPSERDLYEALHFAAQRDLTQAPTGLRTMQMLEALLRLRQAACHPSLLPGPGAPTSTKTELLMELLEACVADGHKSLVFSQWTSYLDLIEPHLGARNITFLRLDGSTPNRERVVSQFQADDGPSVLLLSLKAGGTGLNLTAADHVFLMDLWWNPAVERQATDRAHRIGQEHPVFSHRLVAKGTVEERIVLLQEHKRTLAEATLTDAEQAANLTREDLLELLS